MEEKKRSRLDKPDMTPIRSFRLRMGKIGKKEKSEGLTSAKEREAVCRTLSRVIVQVGRIVWDAIHFPLLFNQSEILSGILSSTSEQEMQKKFLMFNNFAFDDCKNLLTAISTPTNKYSAEDGIFDGVIDVDDNQKLRRYREELQLMAQIFSGNEPVPKTLHDFRGTLKAAKHKKKCIKMEEVDATSDKGIDSSSLLADLHDDSRRRLFQQPSSSPTINVALVGGGIINCDEERPTSATSSHFTIPPPITSATFIECLANDMFMGECPNSGGIISTKRKISLKSINTSSREDTPDMLLNSFCMDLMKARCMKEKDVYLEQIGDILQKYCRFSWKLPFKKETMTQEGLETPGNGFCCYLLQVQAMKYSSPQQDKDKFPSLESDYVLSKEFMELLVAEIDWLSTIVQHTNNANKDPALKLQRKLMSCVEFLKTEIKAGNNNVFMSEHTNSWGSTENCGMAFVARNGCPFSYYSLLDSHTSADPTFMILTNFSSPKNFQGEPTIRFQGDNFFFHRDLMQMADECAINKYAGCYGSRHFFPCRVDVNIKDSIMNAFRNCCLLVASTLEHHICAPTAIAFLDAVVRKDVSKQIVSTASVSCIVLDDGDDDAADIDVSEQTSEDKHSNDEVVRVARNILRCPKIVQNAKQAFSSLKDKAANSDFIQVDESFGNFMEAMRSILDSSPTDDSFSF